MMASPPGEFDDTLIALAQDLDQIGAPCQPEKSA
jgi:hypothetical protein